MHVSWAKYLVFCGALGASLPDVYAAANISSSDGFTAADGIRTYMDIGGVWDGASDVTLSSGGDIFTVTLENTTAEDADETDDVAYDLAVTIDVPDEFILASTVVTPTLSATGVGSCTDVVGTAITSVTASQSSIGGDVTFTIAPASFDLEPECQLSLSYQLYAGPLQTGGTETITAQWQYATTEGGALSSPDTQAQSVLVREGDFVAAKVHNPALATDGSTIGAAVSGKIGTNETFLITVTNARSGALFDVDITDTIGAGFSSLVLSEQSSPVSSTLSFAGNVATIDYLEPDGVVEILAKADITSCSNINNTVEITDKLFASSGESQTALDSVVFALENPAISYSVPAINFDYPMGFPEATVVVSVDNVGTGFSDTIRLDATNLPAGTVTVESGDWSYSANSFTYTGALLGPGESADFTFKITSNACPFNPGTSATRWDIVYENACGSVFTAVPSFSNVSQTSEPTLALSKNVSRFIDTDTTSQYTIVLGGSDVDKYTAVSGVDNDVLLVDSLPASGIRSIVLTSVTDSGDGVVMRTGASEASATAIAVGSPLGAGEVLAIDADLDDLPVTIVVDFVVDDAEASCNAGFVVNNTVQADVLACGVTENATAGFIPNEVVSGGDFGVDHDIAITNASSSPFETGLADDGDGVREDGEGEFIEFAVTMNFVDVRVGANSSYTGSSYTAQLGTDEVNPLTTQTPLTSSGQLQYQFSDNSGALSAVADVPSASISFSAGNALVIDLGFLDTLLLNTGTTDQDQLLLTYKTTVSDADLGAGTARTFIQRGTLEVANGDPNCAPVPIYTAAVEPTIARAAPNISSSFTSVPEGNFVDVCEVIPVTVNVADPSNGLYSDNTRVEFTLGDDWRFMNLMGDDSGSASADINYTGAIFTGDTPDANIIGGGTSSELLRIDAATQPVDFSAGVGNATAQFNIQLQSGFSASNLATRLEYDTNQSRFNLSTSREFNVTDTNTSPVIRRAALSVDVSPDVVFLNDRTVSWTMYVQNTGDGVAYDAVATDTLPDNYALDETASTGDLDDMGVEIMMSDPCYTGNFGAVATPCTVAGQTFSDINTGVWSLGDIQPGATRTIVVVATVENQTGGACDVSSNTTVSPTFKGNLAEASWGCGTIFSAASASSPTYQEPTVKLQATQDTSSSYCDLCSAGEIALEVENTGAGKLFNIVVRQNIGSAGLSYVPGSTEVSINDGAFATFINDDPQITTDGGDTVLVWSATGLTSGSAFDTLLDELDAGTGSGASKFRLRFDLMSPGESLDATSNADRTIALFVDYEPACGVANTDTSSGDPFVLPIREPDVTVTKTGWNIDAGQTEAGGSMPSPSSDLGAVKTVYGGAGDEIVWRLVMSNNSGTDYADAEALFVRDFLSSTNMNITGFCEKTSINSFSSCSDPSDFISFTPPGADVDTERGTTLLTDNVLETGTTIVLYLKGTVLALCDNPLNTTQLEYGCSGEGTEGGIDADSDTARLVTSPDSAFGDLTIIDHAVEGPGGSGTLGVTGQVSFTLVNNGGNAQDIVITDTLPAGFSYDSTVTPTLTYLNTPSHTDLLDTVATTGASTATVPVFSLSDATYGFPAGGAQENLLRSGDRIEITFGIYQTGNTDTTSSGSSRQEGDSGGDGFDPDLPANNLTNALSVTFDNSCSVDQVDVTDNVSVSPLTPDLDIDINSSNATLTYLVAAAGETQLFNIEIENNGDGIAAAASDGIVVTLTIGDGWVSKGASFSDTGYTCNRTATGPDIYQCTLSSDIAVGATTTIGVTLEVDSDALTTSPLSFGAEVRGNILQGDDSDSGADYSFDTIDTAILGFTLSKDTQSCTENPSGISFPVTTANSLTNVQVGEDCTYLISASWFGSPGTTITNLLIEDDFQRNEIGNVGYVSHAVPINEFGGSVVVTDDDGDPLVYGSEEDVLWDFSDGGSGVTLPISGITNVAVEVTTRAKNDPDDVEGVEDDEIRHDLRRANTAIVTFEALGETFNTSSDGYPSATQRRQRIQIVTPNPAVDKLLRNGTSGAFANTAMGQAGDTIEFQVTLTNPAAGSATRADWFDVVLTDNLDANYTVQDFTTDGIDNDGDGLVDGADSVNGEGIFDASGSSGQTIEINASNNADLAALGEGESVVIAYRVTLNSSASPGDDIVNTAVVVGDTLSGANGSASNSGASGQDETGEVLGARQYSVNDTATLTVDSLSTPMSGSKSIIGLSVDSQGVSPSVGSPITSATNSNAAPVDVVIGEEIQYQLSFIVPASTVEDLVLTDTLPAGLSCIEASDVSLDNVIFSVNGGQPSNLNTSGVCVDQTITWDFSNSSTNTIVVSGSATEAQRTVVATLIARVDNEAANVASGASTSDSRVNNTDAEVTFSNSSGAQTLMLDDMFIRIVEPSVVLTKSIAPLTGVDAGDTLTITVTAQNTSTDAVAYNVSIQDDLTSASDLTYVSASAAGSAGVNGQAPDSVNETTTNAPIFIFDAIPTGTTYEFTYQITVDTSVQPLEVLDDTVQASWTSIDDITTALNAAATIGANGSAQGMRNGALPNVSDALNDYEASASAQITSRSLSLTKSDQNSSAVPTIGEHKQYRIVVNLPEGTTQNLSVNDALDSGDESFVLENESGFDISYTLVGITSINGVTTLGTTAEIETAMTAVPADESSGDVTWQFGTIVTATEDDQSTTALTPSITINYFARIPNTVTADAGDSAQNTASLTFNNGETAASTPVAASASPAAITEPALTSAKIVRNLTAGDTFGAAVTAPSPGDVLEYRVTVSNGNSNASTAYDVNIVDQLDAGLSYTSTTSATLNAVDITGTFVETPDTTGAGSRTLTWGRGKSTPDNSLDIPANQSFVLTYRVTVGNDVLAAQNLDNSVVVDWTSLDGADANERTNGGSPDDYETSPQTTRVTSVDNTDLLKAIVIDSFGTGPAATDGEVRIGDTIDYSLTLVLNNGTTNNVVVQDTLPTGMEFVSTVSIDGDVTAPYAGSAPLDFDIVAGDTPTAGASNLTWTFGQIENDGTANATATDNLVIVYRVRITDGDLSAAGTTTLTNDATLDYNDASGAAAQQAADVDVDVLQPILAVTKDVSGGLTAGDTVEAGDTVTYEITVANSGDAPAYDIQVLDVVPAGLRDGGVPVVGDVSITINGGAPTAGDLAPTAVGTFATDGQLRWNFDSGVADAYTLPAGQSLVIEYTLDVDSDIGPGLTLTNSANVSSYFSFDDEAIPASSVVGNRETFAATAADDVDVVTPTPGLLAKAPNQTTATIGETITYTIQLPSTTFGAQLYDVVLSDSLPADVTFVSAAYGTGNAATGTLTTSVDGSNVLTVDTAAGGFDIPANQRAVIDVVVRVDNTAGENAGDLPKQRDVYLGRC